MTTNKGAGSAEAAQPSLECCMCGDYGFSLELFQCKVCQFRSQHRYCSNLYPKAESYRICNWCLNQKGESKEKSPNSSNSSSSHRKSGSFDDEIKNRKIKNGNLAEIHGGKKGQRGIGLVQVQFNEPIKKQRTPAETGSGSGSRSPPTSPSVLGSARKRIITNIGIEENLRRTKSEEISNRIGVSKQVFRNKVRRYKLLDEVSS
ncbi:Zinc ion-binding protein [Quillaja saponaria]|uniref:Zinc ion-binding protein n=1 Tax=Quillaja saponaria TaxID=32244 RepID=A0AAD7LJ48_QUISA|nr:Zinc ion-binding protein [Quillaja saponaria]